MNRFVRKSLFLIFIVGNLCLADFPDNVVRIPRIDLMQADYYRKHESPNCAFAVVAASDAYRRHNAGGTSLDFQYSGRITDPLRERLLAQAKRHDETPYGPAVRAAISALGHYRDDAHLSGIADLLLEEDNNALSAEVLRRPIPEDPYPTTENETFRIHQQLSHLLDVNAIPAFLLEHGAITDSNFQRLRFGRRSIDYEDTFERPEDPLDGASLFFADGIFWGAEISGEELLTFRKQLIGLRTLVHLTVRAHPHQLRSILTNPVLGQLQSLTLQIVAPRPGVTPAEHSQMNDYSSALHDRLQGRFANLRTLRIENHMRDESAQFETSQTLRYFSWATKLETLGLSRIRISDGETPAAFRNLKHIYLNDVAATPADPSEPRQRERLQPFVNGLPRKLETLHWREPATPTSFGRVYGDLFALAPVLANLTDLQIGVAAIDPIQLARLTDDAALWSTLRTFHFQEVGSPYFDQVDRLQLARLFNRGLRRARQLKHLRLDSVLEDVGARILLDGVTAKLEHLDLNAARFRSRGLNELAAQPALSDVQMINVTDSHLTEPGVRAFLNPNLKSLKQLYLGRPGGNECRPVNDTTTLPGRVQRALRALKKRGVEFQFDWQAAPEEEF